MTASIEDQAFEWVKKNKKELINKFCNPLIYPPYEVPSILFMAGSPGAGKTEYSKSLIKQLEEKDKNSKYIRVDADEVRNMIPQFNGKNSSQIQRAASKGVSIILDYAFHNKQNILVDGTFANYEIMDKNIKRALDKTPKIGIFYLYQDPILAWEFTQVREKVEKRKISKSVFIDAFFKAKKNVNLIKEKYGNRIDVNLIIQNRDNSFKKIYFNIESIDNFLENEYTIGSLKNKLRPLHQND